jgi:hypothetical protein
MREGHNTAQHDGCAGLARRRWPSALVGRHLARAGRQGGAQAAGAAGRLLATPAGAAHGAPRGPGERRRGGQPAQGVVQRGGHAAAAARRCERHGERPHAHVSLGTGRCQHPGPVAAALGAGAHHRGCTGLGWAHNEVAFVQTHQPQQRTNAPPCSKPTPHGARPAPRRARDAPRRSMKAPQRPPCSRPPHVPCWGAFPAPRRAPNAYAGAHTHTAPRRSTKAPHRSTHTHTMQPANPHAPRHAHTAPRRSTKAPH